MQIEARSTASEKPFAASEMVFTRLTSRLASGDALAMTHGDLERLLEQEGREVLRQLLQDHLDLRGDGEAGDDVVGAREVRRPQARLRERHLKTIFGTVSVRRMGYSARDAETLFPRDAELNLPPELYSHGVQRRAVDEVVKTSFDQAAASIASTTGTSVPKRQMEEIAVRAAADFDDFYEGRSAQSVKEANTCGDILALSTDAKGIAMRLGALREATRKAAMEQRHKMSKRLSAGEKRNRKRMSQVAAAYTVPPFVREPEDIVRDLGPATEQTDAPIRPRPEHKRVWASIEKEPEEVIDQLFEEGLRRDPGRRKTWVALVDGNPTQLKLIKKAAARHGVEPTIILDVIHVLEYLWKAGFALHDEGSPKTQRWVSQRLLDVLRGKSSTVASAMRRSATMRNMKATARAAVDDCAAYLLKYRSYLRYDQYLAAGLPIATGVIEGACRHLIKDRLEITGACWGLEGAEAVLKLRALRSSGDLAAYWAFHEAAEHRRNHLDLYAGAPPATVRPLKARSRRHLTLVP